MKQAILVIVTTLSIISINTYASDYLKDYLQEGQQRYAQQELERQQAYAQQQMLQNQVNQSMHNNNLRAYGQ